MLVGECLSSLADPRSDIRPLNNQEKGAKGMNKPWAFWLIMVASPFAGLLIGGILNLPIKLDRIAVAVELIAHKCQ